MSINIDIIFDYLGRLKLVTVVRELCFIAQISTTEVILSLGRRILGFAPNWLFLLQHGRQGPGIPFCGCSLLRVLISSGVGSCTRICRRVRFLH